MYIVFHLHHYESLISQLNILYFVKCLFLDKLFVIVYHIYLSNMFQNQVFIKMLARGHSPVTALNPVLDLPDKRPEYRVPT